MQKDGGKKRRTDWRGQDHRCKLGATLVTFELLFSQHFCSYTTLQN